MQHKQPGQTPPAHRLPRRADPTRGSSQQRSTYRAGAHSGAHPPATTSAKPEAKAEVQLRQVSTIASSRTGTAQWKAIVKIVRAHAIEMGIFKCPLCGTGLDWLHSKRPNSAEVDHIIPHAQGGEDSVDNARIICRHCNQSRGGKEGRAKQLKPQRVELQTKANW